MMCVYACEGYAIAAGGNAVEESDLKRAEAVLKECLKDKEWHSCDEVREVIKRLEIPKKTFRQARNNLSIETRNNGDGTWDWRIP